MGCATSKFKLQDSPAVALCRDRCALLDLALRHLFTFAQAHAAYLLSLNSFALSLHRFSTLNLPPRPRPLVRQRQPDPSSPYTPPDDHYGNLNFDDIPAAGGYFFNMSHMKNQSTPSVLHTQPPLLLSQQTMYVGEFSASPSSNNPNSSSSTTTTTTTTISKNQNDNPPSESYPDHNFINDVVNYGGYPHYGAGGGVLGDSSLPAISSGGFLSPPALPSSSSNAPPPKPPPPPPPRSSTWDFLNPFDTAGSSYPAGHDSRDLRGAEGVPDLEDEDAVVVKEINVDQIQSARFVGGGRRGVRSNTVTQEDVLVAKHKVVRSNVGRESDSVEYGVHKNEDAAQGSIKDGGNDSGFKHAGTSFKGELEVVREIQAQFERASDSGSELAKFLEIGKLPYNGKSSTNQVASKILHLPLPSLSKGYDNAADPPVLDMDEDAELSSINLSSTLHKLRLWENKLYEEVKFAEKMRVLHERKSKGLKHLDERGAEAPKVDATRNLVRSLSTKIKIAMQVVDKISVKINELRDGELWTQLHELIHRLTRMWKSMLECHRSQCQAIREAKHLDAIAFHKHFGDTHFEATCQLGSDLINWTLGFSCWVAAQKDYARVLNNWLMKCLHYVPEETADGIPPFSPGRIGAPPVFVVCNQWSKSMDRISEEEVMDTMRDFALHVLLLGEQEKAEMRQQMSSKKDGRKLKSLERQEHKIRKEIHALDKRMLIISNVDNVTPLTGGHAGHQREKETSSEGRRGSLQASLQHVLEAMEKFAASSLKIYEDLLKHIDEEGGVGRENEKVS